MLCLLAPRRPPRLLTRRRSLALLIAAAAFWRLWPRGVPGAAGWGMVLPGSCLGGRRELVEWVRSQGGFVHDAVDFAPLEGKGNAVVARREIPAETLVLAVPGKLDLERSLLEHDHLLPTALQERGHVGDKWRLVARLRLAAHLALTLESPSSHERTDGFYAPYWATVDINECADYISQISNATEWDLLRGSAEFYRPLRCRDMLHFVDAINDMDGRNTEGDDESKGSTRLLNGTAVLLADRFIAMRAFDDHQGDLHLLPLTVDFNHDTEARAAVWWQWDEQQDVLRFWTKRAVIAGEELTQCYGVKSNANLLCSYGFTLRPQEEPLFSFRATPVLAAQLGGACAEQVTSSVLLTTLPHACKTDAASDIPSMESLSNFLRRATASGHLADGALEDLVGAFHDSYERDVVIREQVEQLRANRRLHPTTWVWWEELLDDPSSSQAGHRDNSHPTHGSSRSRWRSDVIRMKMSEYLCLLIYAEALALRKGDMRSDDALPQSRALLLVLRTLLDDGRIYES